MKSAEGNRAIVQRFVEAVQHGGNRMALDELTGPGYVNLRPPPGVPADRAGLTQLTALPRRACPDGRMTIEDMVTDGDRVMLARRSAGLTQEG